MFYVMYLGYVCVATLCGLVLFLAIFVTIVRQRRQQDPHMIADHVVTLLVVHSLLGAAWVLGVLAARHGAAWVLGVLTARHGGLGLNVAFCIVNSCLGLAILVRCMFDFRLRSLCADLTFDSVQDDQRRRRHPSQDSWSHDSSPAAVGRTAVYLTRDDTRDVFAGNSIITPAPQNGKGWRRPHRGDVDKMEALKYGKPEVHCADALQGTPNDVRRAETGVTQPADSTAHVGNNVVTDNANELLTYI